MKDILEKEVDVLSEKVETKVKSAFSEIFKLHIRGNNAEQGNIFTELQDLRAGKRSNAGRS